MSTTAPTMFQHVLIISHVELNRLFRTRRGWLLLFAFTVIWYLLLRYPIYQAASLLHNQGLSSMFNDLFSAVSIDHLIDWPSMELAIYWMLGIVIFPVFAITTSADQTASDNNRGTLRFLCLRCCRDSLLLGRFLGQVALQAMMVAVTVSVTLLMSLYRDHSEAGASLGLTLWIATHLIILLLPFIALMTLLNCWLRSPRLSLLAIIVGFPVIQIIFGIIGDFWPPMAFIDHWLPGSQLIDLMQSQGWESLPYITAPLLQTFFLLLAARFIFHRSAL